MYTLFQPYALESKLKFLKTHHFYEILNEEFNLFLICFMMGSWIVVINLTVIMYFYKKVNG